MKPQNRNGLTDTKISPSADCSTVKSTCFCAVVSPTVTDNNPLQLTACVARLREFMMTVSSKVYTAASFAFSQIANFSVSAFASNFVDSSLIYLPPVTFVLRALAPAEFAIISATVLEFLTA
jgi:hypothetical protein